MKKVASLNPLVRNLTGHTDQVNALVLLSDGSLASGSSDNTVRIWNPCSGTLLRTLIGHTKGVTALALLSDGSLASASSDGTVRVWNPLAGTLIRTFSEPNLYQINALALLPDGTLAFGGSSGIIRIWNPFTGAVVMNMTDGYSSAVLVSFPDGTLASSPCGYYCGSIRIWNPSNGTLIRSIGNSANPLLVLPDGSLAAGYTYGYPASLNPLTGSQTRQYSCGYGTFSFALLSDGSLAIGSSYSNICIVNPATSQQLRTLSLGYQGNVLALALLADGTFASYTVGNPNYSINIWR